MHHPEWLDRTAYPFTSRFFDSPAGRLHYIDEGAGPPVVLVHGTPVWSFLYRNLIQRLAGSHRCIAMDHLGFGLSERPAGWGYRVADQAQNLARLLEHLKLGEFTLIVHDFGGPIGLSYALDNPEQVTRLVLFNTWMWSLADNREAQQISGLMCGRLGRLLYTRLNFSARFLVPFVMGDRRKLTRAVHRHYTAAAGPGPADRHAAWTFACELIGASAWYDQLWSRRERIKEHPALLLWGLKDPGVRSQVFDLARWQGLFTQAQTVTFPTAGHFVMEEEPDQVGAAVAAFLTPAAAYV